MKPPSRASSSKRKMAALNVKKAVMKKNKRLSDPSVVQTAKAMSRVRKKLPASGTTKPSSSRQRDKVVADKLFWILISNIHENVAYEDIVRALFQRCVLIRSTGANPSNLGGHFQDNIKVAFKTKKDAKEAVEQFQNRIRLFRKIWRIHHHKPSSSDATSPSSLRISAIRESSYKELAKLKQAVQDAAVGTGRRARVVITNIHEKVPREVVGPLFSLAGRVRSLDAHDNSNGIFQGTVELEYERREDAAAAIRLFDENITFFGKTWYVALSDDDDAESDDEDDESDDDDDDDDDEDDDDNDEDDDDDA